MTAAASWVFDTGVQDHRADVLECPPAELAGEIAGNVAVERLVVATVRIAYARVQKKSPQARILLPAMHAVERAVGVALEQGVITPPARMACAEGEASAHPHTTVHSIYSNRSCHFPLSKAVLAYQNQVGSAKNLD